MFIGGPSGRLIAADTLVSTECWPLQVVHTKTLDCAIWHLLIGSVCNVHQQLLAFKQLSK